MDDAMNDSVAVLSSYDKYTTFTFREVTLSFRSCDNLDRYTKVNLWDNGYLEVMAKYKNRNEEIEEYIDLRPVLENLYMDKDSFLKPIRSVRVEYT